MAFRVLFKGNRQRVIDGNSPGYVAQAAERAASSAIADAVRDTVKHGDLSIGYSAGDSQPMMRFIDADSYCEQVIPLRKFLKKEVGDHYMAATGEDIVGRRFAQFMLSAVDHFIKEERAGNKPQ